MKYGNINITLGTFGDEEAWKLGRGTLAAELLLKKKEGEKQFIN